MGKMTKKEAVLIWNRLQSYKAADVLIRERKAKRNG
jgi:hypothetical protein